MMDAVKRTVVMTRLPMFCGARKFLRSIVRGAASLFAWTIGGIVMAALYVIEPFARLRFCHIGSVERLGWECVGPDHLLRKWQVHPRQKGIYFFLMHSPDNEQLMRMWKRVVRVIDNKAINKFADFIAGPMSRTRFFIYDQEKTDYWTIYPGFGDATPISRPSLFFTVEEERYGQAQLRKMGIGENDWFVCFHSRDEAHYSSCHMPHHRHRNSHVENYLKAAELITQRGGFAIRMGASVAQALPEHGNKKIIDYATQYRSDFMDVYLLAKTRFFLGNSSGIFAVSFVFDRPCIFANFVSFMGTYIPNGCLWQPKLIRRISTGEFLHIDEIAERDLLVPNAQQILAMEGMNLEFVENTAEDILNICADMFAQIEGVPLPEATISLQERYRERFQTEERHKYVPNIAPSFIVTHQDILN